MIVDEEDWNFKRTELEARLITSAYKLAQHTGGESFKIPAKLLGPDKVVMFGSLDNLPLMVPPRIRPPGKLAVFAVNWFMIWATLQVTMALASADASWSSRILLLLSIIGVFVSGWVYGRK